MLTFCEKSMGKVLATLPAAAAGAFACAAAARQVANYEKFTQFKSPTPRKLLTDLCLPMDGLLNESLWRHNLKEVLKLMPADDEGHWLSRALAEDALASLAYAIEFFIELDPKYAQNAARRAYEAADQGTIHLLGGLEPGMEDRILGHPIVQRELERQARDLKMLKQGKWDAFKKLYLQETLLSESEWLELLK